MSITEVFGGIQHFAYSCTCISIYIQKLLPWMWNFCLLFTISVFMMVEFRTGKTQLSHTLCGKVHYVVPSLFITVFMFMYWPMDKKLSAPYSSHSRPTFITVTSQLPGSNGYSGGKVCFIDTEVSSLHSAFAYYVHTFYRDWGLCVCVCMRVCVRYLFTYIHVLSPLVGFCLPTLRTHCILHSTEQHYKLSAILAFI